MHCPLTDKVKTDSNYLSSYDDLGAGGRKPAPFNKKSTGTVWCSLLLCLSVTGSQGTRLPPSRVFSWPGRKELLQLNPGTFSSLPSSSRHAWKHCSSDSFVCSICMLILWATILPLTCFVDSNVNSIPGDRVDSSNFATVTSVGCSFLKSPQ